MILTVAVYAEMAVSSHYRVAHKVPKGVTKPVSFCFGVAIYEKIVLTLFTFCNWV